MELTIVTGFAATDHGRARPTTPAARATRSATRRPWAFAAGEPTAQQPHPALDVAPART